MTSHRVCLYLGAMLALAMISGCKKNEDIQVYRVSKAEQESPSSPNSAAGMPGADNTGPMSGLPPMSSAPAGGGAPGEQTLPIASNPPADWKAQPLSSMRQASYLVSGDHGATADISLVMLGGQAGGTLENVNRWLSQLGQPAITDEKLAQTGKHVNAPLGDVTIVDLEGLPQGADPAKDGRIVGGILSEPNATIFFKMRGNSELVEAQKEAFVKWIGTVQLADSAPAPAASTNAPAPMPSMASSSAPEQKPAIKWTAPADWKSVPPSAMRYASFAVDGQDGAKADVSVSVFGGDGGGDLQNVNRWREQIGLQTIADSDMKSLVVPVKAIDSDFSMIDMNGSKGRILAAWTRIDGSAWFFKLTGPDALVAGQKDQFTKFLQSVQFHP